ncbi:MAG: MFS transporter [Candidatus Levyibacteriota bacterium]
MIKQQFIGKNPSHFQVNPLVKSFIISEAFLWSSWNFVIPIFAIFVANKVAGGNINIAATGFSTYYISRIIFELVSSKYFSKSTDNKKLKVTILGIAFISIAYFGFAFTKTVVPIFIFYILAGTGLGIASPLKNSLFSTHLDKDKEPFEWSIYDTVIFMGMAMATALGGFIASTYGFSVLFILAAIVNLLAAFPYILFVRK